MSKYSASMAEGDNSIVLSHVFGCVDGYQDVAGGDRTRHFRVSVEATANYQDVLANTSYRLISNTDAHFTFSLEDDGYATAVSPYLAANCPEVFHTTQTRTRFSIIRDSEDGYAYLSEMLDRDPS